MDSEGLKEQLGKSKKMLIALGGVVLFGVYMLWPSGADPLLGQVVIWVTLEVPHLKQETQIFLEHLLGMEPILFCFYPITPRV